MDVFISALISDYCDCCRSAVVEKDEKEKKGSGSLKTYCYSLQSYSVLISVAVGLNQVFSAERAEWRGDRGVTGVT